MGFSIMSIDIAMGIAGTSQGSDGGTGVAANFSGVITAPFGGTIIMFLSPETSLSGTVAMSDPSVVNFQGQYDTNAWSVSVTTDVFSDDTPIPNDTVFCTIKAIVAS